MPNTSSFLPPSSPYRLPLAVLTLFSLGFFAFLLWCLTSSQQEHAYVRATQPLKIAKHVSKSVAQPVTKPISAFKNNLVAHAAESIKPTSLPVASGYCLRVPILLYHHIEPMAQATKEKHEKLTVDRDIFEKQLAYLNDHKYNTITLDSLVNALTTKTQLPPKSIVLTIDDGYLDSYQYVFPLLKQYNIIANFMLPTGLIENNGYMNWSQVKEMAADSHVSLYNHTWSHAALGQVNKAKIDFELSTSKQDFLNHLGHMSNVLVYPYGSHNDLVIREAQSLGFVAAVTTKPGRMQCDSQLMKLPRDHVGNAPLSAYGL